MDMPWLAIDTATDIATVAIKKNELVFSVEKKGVSSHAQTLLPIIQNLMQQAQISFSDLNGIVVGRGPGSFTGLRVACAMVKGLAFPFDLPIYPVSDLACIAWIAKKHYPNHPILAVMDARMQQVYWGLYADPLSETEEHVGCLSEVELKIQKPVVLAGYQYESYRHLLSTVIAEHVIKPEALAMIEMVETGRIEKISAELLEPTYVRNQVTQGATRG
jgi:tRNA threonylcarbamoyladenosine biosynthesis protein TsaB